MFLLAIETSCDETAAAVLDGGARVLSNIVLSQDEIHAPFGGVVPELASRQHLRAIDPVVRMSLTAAGVSLGSIDAFAVTQGPGLIGSLLVGVSFAKGLAWIPAGHILRMSPPIVMDLDVAAKCMDIIDDAIGKAERQFGYSR